MNRKPTECGVCLGTGRVGIVNASIRRNPLVPDVPWDGPEPRRGVIVRRSFGAHNADCPACAGTGTRETINPEAT